MGSFNLCEDMTARQLYRVVWLMAGIVLACGWLLPPLMDFDAAQIGTISMGMFQRGDWLTILNRSYTGGYLYDYLDKPHLVYWSAMLGYKIFGIGHTGMRFFSILATLVAAWAVAKLAMRLYGAEAGRWAALIFLTSQAIMLANHDVRTDSLLTAFTALAVWQLVIWVETRRWLPFVAGFLFLALSVGSKGLIGPIVAGCALFFFLLGRRDWSGILNARWPLGLLVFFVGLSPFLYAYYLQFDMHPEKLVNGGNGRSGVKFLLWSHSMDRFAGNRDLVASPEFSFFFHTILWAFLPWTIVLVTGVWDRLRGLWTSRGSSFFSQEQLSFAGVWVMFCVMSMAKFKLPHYLNILFPLLAVSAAGWLWRLQLAGRVGFLKGLWKVHGWLSGILLLAVGIIVVWSFPLTNIWISLGLIGFGGLAYYIRRRHDLVAADRLVLYTASVALMVNLVLNAHFYPNLLAYQSGNRMPAVLKEQGVQPSDLKLYGRVVRSLDFYLQRSVPVVDSLEIHRLAEGGQEVKLFVSAGSHDSLLLQYPSARLLAEVPDMRVTRLTLRFMDPAKRMEQMPMGGLYVVGAAELPKK